MARKDTARGRAFELTVARLFGLQRRGGALSGSDCIPFEGDPHFPIALECKAHEKLQLRESWVRQARGHAKKEGRSWWALVQRPKGWQEPVVTIDLSFLIYLCVRAGIITSDVALSGEPDYGIAEPPQG